MTKTIEKPKRLQIPKAMLENEVWHGHAGGGWAVIELYPEEWARVVQVGVNGIGDQAFLVWTRKLTTGKPLKEIFPQTVDTINAIRTSIEIGEMEVVNTRFVKTR